MRLLPFLFTAMLLGFNTEAQTPAQFKDFDVAPGIYSAAPTYLHAFDGKLYFYASDGNTGREPHYVVGTGTAMLIKNMNAASNHCIGVNYNNPVAGMNGKIYFTAENGSTGEEMFMYDGTNPPSLVFDPTFDQDSSSPDNYTVFNNVLYYTASTVSEGQELWAYTGSGTPMRLTDIDTGTGDGVSGPLFAYNNRIYFVGNSTEGAELWAYNPTSQKAEIVADIEPGASSSNPANFTSLNGNLYFSAATYLYGRELYEYDGSTNPPKRVTDISINSLSSLSPVHSNAFAWFKDKVYFGARDTLGETHLWSYDPANSNVTLEQKINPGGDSRPREFVVYNNKLFFSANNGTNGFELHSYDGTNPPTLVGDLCAGANSSIPSELTVIGDELYFSANNCNNSGIDLFSYNYKRVSIQQVGVVADLTVYPNPATDNLHVEISLEKQEELSISLVDMNGKTVYEKPSYKYNAGNNNITIPVSALPAGTYICRINNTDKTYFVKKILIQ